MVPDRIDLLRHEAFDRLLLAVEKLIDDFGSDRISCTFECNAMRCEALAKELSFRTLLFLHPQILFLGYSIEDTTASVGEVRDPKQCSGNDQSHSYYRSYGQSHNWKLASEI